MVAPPDSPGTGLVIPRLSFQSDSPTNFPVDFPFKFSFKVPFKFSFKVPFKFSFKVLTVDRERKTGITGVPFGRTEVSIPFF